MSNIKCQRCGSEMLFDDADMEFRGKGTEYFICSNERCDCSMTQEIRFNQVTERSWYWDDDIRKTEKIAWTLPTYLDGSEF